MPKALRSFADLDVYAPDTLAIVGLLLDDSSVLDVMTARDMARNPQDALMGRKGPQAYTHVLSLTHTAQDLSRALVEDNDLLSDHGYRLST